MPPPPVRLKPDSLAYALLMAARAVLRVQNGTALPQALAAVFMQTDAPPNVRGAVQDIAYRSLRQLGTSEAVLRHLTDKPVTPAQLHALLCCALGLLRPAADEERAPYEAHTLVDQAVRAAEAEPVTARAKGMVNAVLRRFLRERETLDGVLQSDAVARWNYPLWWIEQVRAAYPQQWQAILEAGNRAPPLSLRVNRRRSSAAHYLEKLAQTGLGGMQIEPDAVRLSRALPVMQIPGFAEGEVSVQDAAAQLAAPLLDVQDGMRVLDACAAPGGKTGHLLECADIELTALDSDPQRLQRIEENLQRLQLRAQVRQGDAAGRDWWDGQPFDRVLADVPCTASGIVRRHPDIRWLRRPEDAARLSALSAAILDNLWGVLRPGGKLLLVTCSLWPQESEQQAAAFALRHGAQRLSAPGQLLPQATAIEDHDGLFYALFAKPAL